MAVEGEEGDIDLLNDETFGEGAVEYDWEASHFSKVAAADESHDRSLPLHHDDIIIKAVPVQQHLHSEQEQLLPKLNELKIKELWPSSPQQEEASMLDSIWSSPELPVRPKKQAMGSPSLPPGSKAVTLEELEREYITPSPPTNSASQSSSNHTPPPGAIAPPPGVTTASTPPTGPSHLMGPRPPPMGQVPPMGIPRPHPMMGWMMRPQGRYPLPPGYPPPRGPLPNVPIRPPRQGQVPRHPFPSHGPPPPHHSHRQQPPHPHHHHGPHHHHHPHHMQHWSRDAPEAAPRKSRRSEYLNEMKADGSGFMTQKEKEWVIRIQLLQLQSPDPSNDDYYYQNFMKRKLLLEEQKRNHPQPSHDHCPSPSSDTNENSSNHSQLLTLPQIERKERNYRPIEFQGTLGKVAPSSISAPRKTIDVPLSGGSGGGVEGAKDTYTKKKQTLAVIEKLYLHVLELEGMEQTVLSLPEEERAELLTRRDGICQEMFSLLKLKTLDKPWTRNDDVTVQLMMGYRKGKRVMKRVLPMLSDEHAQIVLLALIRNLSTIMKKDSTDQIMPELTPCVQAVVAGLDLPLVNLSLSSLLTVSTTSTSASSSAIVRAMQGEFGVSLVLGLVRRGGKLAVSSQDPPNRAHEEWVSLTKDLSMELHPHLSASSSKSAATLLATLASLPHLQQ